MSLRFRPCRSAGCILISFAIGVAMAGPTRAEALPGGPAAPSVRASSVPEDGALAQAAQLRSIVRLALERNRDLAESRFRVLAAEARSHSATRLPDPELKYEQWGVPLAHPLSLDRADTLMLGVRQSLPAWGTLEARGRATEEEAGRVRDSARARQQDVVAQVLRTFAIYYRADREVALHLEHVQLTSRILELARLNQRTGHGTIQDVLRMELELTRLHTNLARLRGEQRSSGAMLNALMARPLDAPLGPPEEIAVVAPVEVTALEKVVDKQRPEIVSAGRAIRRSEASLDELRRAAWIPSVMLGLDYWYMPMGAQFHHGYGAMVSLNLPWFSGRGRDAEKEAQHNLAADQQALEATRTVARYEVRDASARLEAAREALAIIDEKLMTQARRNLEATQAAYASGQGDSIAVLEALRSSLEVRIERVRAIAELASMQADLQRAAGTLAEEGAGR